MPKVKTSELIGSALDWAVASCGLNGREWENVHFGNFRVSCGKLYLNTVVTFPYNPSTDWMHGGPIVEKMLEAGLILQARPESSRWAASVDSPNRFVHGPTALIAAMRCYVVSRLGDEVELPDGLL